MKIGLSSYSLRSSFQKGVFEFGDFSFMKETFPEIDGLEVLQAHMEQYLEDTEVEDLQELQKNIQNANLDWFAITTASGEFGSNALPHYLPDAEYIKGFDRLKEFRLGFALEWIELASELGIKLMRIDSGSFFYNHKIPITKAIKFNIDKEIEVYSELCDEGKKHGIEIGIENHGGFASDIDVLDQLFQGVPDLKLCFDNGNVPDKDRIDMINRFGDRIHFVHAKTHVFDENGMEKYYNFEEIINALKNNGFDGWMSIEYEGSGPEIPGIKNSIKNLIKYI